MISITQLQRSLFNLFNLASKDGLQIKVAYKAHVYLLTIERTTEPYKRKKYSQISKLKKTGLKLITEECPDCRSIMVGGICISNNCIRNKKD